MHHGCPDWRGLPCVASQKATAAKLTTQLEKRALVHGDADLVHLRRIGLDTAYFWFEDAAPLVTAEVPLARLPRCMDGLKLFLISDQHVGPS